MQSSLCNDRSCLRIDKCRRISYAQSTSIATVTSYDQYILNQQSAMTPLVQKALSPTSNASLPSDLSDIVTTGQLLASKEFTAAGNAQTANKTALELRYSNSALDVDKHLINLVTQYEWDIHQGQQARMTGQVSDLAGILQNIQWKDVRVFDISRSVAKYNLTMPAGMADANTEVSNAKQDVQSIFVHENNGADYKTIDKILSHASKQFTDGRATDPRVSKDSRSEDRSCKGRDFN